MIGVAIIGAHALHLSTLGTENIIIGSVTEQIGYPPKSVFRWYAKTIAKFETEEGLEKPLHFALKQCASFDPLTLDCLKLFEIMKKKKTINFNDHSNSPYKFTPTYIAIMNCNLDMVIYLRGKNVNVDKKPGPGAYENVNTLQFLYSTSCLNKTQLKQALFGKASKKYYGDFLESKSWNRSKLFQ